MIQYCQICDSHGLVGRPVFNISLIPIDTFIKSGCEFLDVSYDEIMGVVRKRKTVDARQMIMAYLCAYPKFRVVEVGRGFDKDHTTVVHAKSQVYSLCFSEPNYKFKYTSLIDHLNNLINQ